MKLQHELSPAEDMHCCLDLHFGFALSLGLAGAEETCELQETYSKLQHELSLAEEKLRKAQQQGKLAEGERKVLDSGIAKANNSIKVCCPAVLWTSSRVQAVCKRGKCNLRQQQQ